MKIYMIYLACSGETNHVPLSSNSGSYDVLTDSQHGQSIVSMTGIDWLQSLIQFFTYICSQSYSDGSVFTEPSELDLLQVYDLTH